MQLFSIEQLLEMRALARGLVGEFFGPMLSVFWQNILEFFPRFSGALVAGDWAEVVMRLVILIGSVVIIYRLVRRLLFRLTDPLGMA